MGKLAIVLLMKDKVWVSWRSSLKIKKSINVVDMLTSELPCHFLSFKVGCSPSVLLCLFIVCMLKLSH